MGYHSAEMSQISTSEENMIAMKKAIDELGMNICALSTSIGDREDSLSYHFDELVQKAKELDCDYVRIGALPSEYVGKKASYLDFAKQINDYGQRLGDKGIKLFYHNHEFEFEKIDGQFALDLLVENTNPKHVGFELDVHWIQRGGQNPTKWIEKLEGRAEIVHLKDYRVVTNKAQNIEGVRPHVIEFAEIGEGSLDFIDIIEACKATGVRYMPIEQDQTYDRTSYEALQISMNNLKKMGYSSNF
jgi:sugar phosphate isomerase/epimerase